VVTWTGSCAEDGLALGEGVLEWKNIERYTGTMKNGRKDGHGKLVNRWGDTYEGGYKAGVFDGKGTYVWSDTARYEGEYLNGYPNGSGVYTFRNEVHRGEWKNGCFNDGKETFRINDNDVVACSF
jgi:hypothetical protein